MLFFCGVKVRRHLLTSLSMKRARFQKMHVGLSDYLQSSKSILMIARGIGFRPNAKPALEHGLKPLSSPRVKSDDEIETSHRQSNNTSDRSGGSVFLKSIGFSNDLSKRAVLVNVIVVRLILSVTVIILFSCLAGCHAVPVPSNANSAPTVSPPQKTPFTLSIVPTRSSSDARVITIARQRPHEFYVVLTNISNEQQPVWETWNSWGSRTISFEFTLDNNRRILVTRGPEGFTRNFPSTFLIPPGEHKVYAIRLDSWWDTGSIPKTPEMPISLKAVFDVSNTPEATEYHVWTGHVESGSYRFTLSQW
jgi:hypothetical protein